MEKRLRQALVAALFLSSPPPARADWPQFRGTPDHTAVASGAAGTLLIPLWSVRLPAVSTGGASYPGRITGSPAIVGDLVYVGSHNTRFYAFRSGTGAKEWEYPAAAPVLSSPLVHEGVAYFTTTNGDLVALDAVTGAFRWKHNSGGFQDQSSPNVVGELIVCGATFPQRKIYAVSRTTGPPEVWHSDTGQPVFSSPAVDPGTGNLVCGSNDGKLFGLRADGSALWAAPFATEGGIFLASPSLANGRAYLAPGDYDTRLYAVDLTTGAKAWETPLPPTPVLPPGVTSRVTVSSPAVDGSFLAVVGGYGNAFGPSVLYAFQDAGAQALPLWTTELPNRVTDSFVSSPAITPGSIIVGIAAPESTGQPDLPRGRLYVVDRETGASRWYAAGSPAEGLHGGPILSSPAVSGSLVVVGDDSGLLSAYRLAVAGDLDGDRAVTLLDVVVGLRAVASGQGSERSLVEQADVFPGDAPRADGTRSFGDGQVTIADNVRLMRRCSGLDANPWP